MSARDIANVVTEDICREARQRFAEHVANAPPDIAQLMTFPGLRTAFEAFYQTGYAEGMLRGRAFEGKIDKAIRESN